MVQSVTIVCPILKAEEQNGTKLVAVISNKSTLELEVFQTPLIDQ